MSLTFWFDVHSPWVYLASPRIGPITRKHGLALAWRPIHLPRLLDRTGGVKPLEANPARVAWFKRDIADFAELQGMPLQPHRAYPLRNSRALRACHYAEEQGRAEAFVIRLTRAYWAEQGDITDLESLAHWAAECRLDGAAVKAAAVSETYKAAIDRNTEQAIARGVFGVPTVDTGTKLYFGNDRLDLLDIHLGKRVVTP